MLSAQYQSVALPPSWTNFQFSASFAVLFSTRMPWTATFLSCKTLTTKKFNNERSQPKPRLKRPGSRVENEPYEAALLLALPVGRLQTGNTSTPDQTVPKRASAAWVRKVS